MQTRARLLAACAAAFLIAGAIRAATPIEVSAETTKANAFFERVFEAGIARSPMFMTQLGMKTDYDKWDDISEAHSLEDLVIEVQNLAELKHTINFDLLD